MTRDELTIVLAEYTQVIHDALEHETDHENRPHYLGHLAMCARMFKILHLDQPIRELEQIHRIESQSHIMVRLPGEVAAATRDAWQAFAPKLRVFIDQRRQGVF